MVALCTKTMISVTANFVQDLAQTAEISNSEYSFRKMNKSQKLLCIHKTVFIIHTRACMHGDYMTLYMYTDNTHTHTHTHTHTNLLTTNLVSLIYD